MTSRDPGRALVLAAMAGTTACALILDWDPAGLPCDKDKRCADGFSCLVNRCVEEGSLGMGDTCSQPEQCAKFPDVTCGSNPFTCRTRCRDLYGAPGDCQADEFCRPEKSRDFEDQWIGTCFESECLRDEDCRTDRVCVKISQAAGACLLECSYDFTTGSYRDNCGSSVDSEQYCQPIGQSGDQTLVCLEALGDNRASLASPCKPVENPCEDEMACVEGQCRFYCANDNCTSGSYCQDFANDGGEILFAACLPN